MYSFEDSRDDRKMEVAEFLRQNKLLQYYDRFIDEGFDTLLSIYDITEHDLMMLGVKRGHRRLLQRAIATARGIPFHTPLVINRDHEGSASSVVATPDPANSKRSNHFYKKRKIYVPARPVTPFDEFHDECKYREIGCKSDINRNKLYERWHSLTPTDKEKYERQALHANSNYVMDMPLSEEE
ncbi:hypothetical protein BDB01DRAFT_772709 [Pilobolus umbonatus]|nr:hypothetical protein BDB01DRAFT_772709 [Pilobolus umbonatus]